MAVRENYLDPDGCPDRFSSKTAVARSSSETATAASIDSLIVREQQRNSNSGTTQRGKIFDQRKSMDDYDIFSDVVLFLKQKKSKILLFPTAKGL
eukprot:CAMPEP_0201233078 /NCGR_PEP_ID=MMETSP0852-20130820/4912_1 /ASSEMBLY_ACC=CAM_ASM_000632 /TAXON_ID=183588 /ORGANISM="Pseudo-nitzschia fraudulenta, Strain WWA7" /LENGTH=94 /DNA_ID=CAMNT_0047525779 /DNA_START=329 /DNA_END=613 /DNA_ORIENTATION=-